MTRLRLSIGMPVFNAEQYLEKAIRSMLNQTFTEFELILSDNSSKDRTLEICRDFASQDRRINVYESDYNRGGGWNHNRVLHLARGHYFKWATHDDMCDPHMLERCINGLERDKGAVLAYPRTTIIDHNDNIIEHYNLELRADSPDVATRFHDLIMTYHQCYQIYGTIRMSALKSTGPMGNFVNGDGVLLANLALYGHFHKIPDFLFFSRRHPAQSSQLAPSRLGTRRLRLTSRVNGLPCTEWWDPAKRKALTFPQWRQLSEYVRAVNRAPLAFRDRLDCYAVIARWAVRDRRRYAKDLLIGADQLIHNMSAPRNERTLQHTRGGL